MSGPRVGVGEGWRVDVGWGGGVVGWGGKVTGVDASRGMAGVGGGVVVAVVIMGDVTDAITHFVLRSLSFTRPQKQKLTMQQWSALYCWQSLVVTHLTNSPELKLS